MGLKEDDIWGTLSRGLVEKYRLDPEYRARKVSLGMEELDAMHNEVAGAVEALVMDNGLGAFRAVEVALRKDVVEVNAPAGFLFVRMEHPRLPSVMVMTEEMGVMG